MSVSAAWYLTDELLAASEIQPHASVCVRLQAEHNMALNASLLMTDDIHAVWIMFILNKPMVGARC